MVYVQLVVLGFLFVWGHRQRGRPGRWVWGLLIPMTGGNVPAAAVLAVVLQGASVGLFGGAILVGAQIGPEAVVCATLLAGLVHAPLLLLSESNSGEYYAFVRAVPANAGASPGQQRAAAWSGGAAGLVSLVPTLVLPFGAVLS